MKDLLTVLQDNAGGTSTMRLLAFLIIGQLVLGKVVGQITSGEPQPWTYEDIGLVLAVLGCKSHQRGKEQAAPDTPST
jgi:hypothetical protein